MASSHDPESYIDILCNYPAIDNHAHPLLTAENRNRLAFEGLTSEAEGPALEDAVYTLPHSTARRDLSRLYDLPLHVSWEDIKKHRAELSYDDLCRLCFEKAKIQCILIDDGLSGVKEMAEEYRWHDRYTSSPTRRIVRVEVVAEVCGQVCNLPRACPSPSEIHTSRTFSQSSLKRGTSILIPG
jgi:hypothetical protein